MGDAKKNEDDSSDEGLKQEEAIEFLKLVEQARAEGAVPQPTLEEPQDIPKPKKRFGLKSKGKKKKKKPKPKKAPEPEKISNETVMAILEGQDPPAASPPGKASDKPKAEAVKVPRPQPASKNNGSRWLVGLMAVAVALVAFVAKSYWPSSPTPVQATSSPTPVQPSAAPRPTVPATHGQPPDLTTTDFLRALSSKRYSDAHALLSDQKQAELSVTALEQSVSEFMKLNPESLTQVRVHSIQKLGPSAQVFLKVGGSETVWEATLLQQDRRWVVHSIGGGLSI
jgi:hypothetical protein